MVDRIGGWFPLLLVAALAGITFWLDRAVQPPAPTRDPTNTDPDYIVDGLSAVRMDREGRVQHTLRAQKMTHYPETDTTLLVEPRLVTYAGDQLPITVTSRRARVSANGENVYFEDGVRVVRAASGPRGELVLETSFLHVIPDAKLAKTDKPVVIRDGGGAVTAAGLELNSETRILNLHGRVKGTFDARDGRK